MKITKEALEKAHRLYEERVDDWKFYATAYEGGREFIETALFKHSEKESDANYAKRLDAGICFNYCTSIVDLFNFYLTEKLPVRYLHSLDEDKQWQMFLLDSDLKGTNYDLFLNESQKIASVYGSIGILIDKANVEVYNKKQEVNLGIYPYLSAYTLENILDWKFERSKVNGRPELKYLKLYDGDGQYRIWTDKLWETWYFDADEDQLEEPIRTGRGINPLGEIPFVWMPNVRNFKYPMFGISDIKEISLITASIIRNISCGDEVIDMAGFPMFRKPMIQEGQEDTEDVVGIRAVQEFDPELGESGKPDWLESEVLEPIQAILEWTDRKADEIYRISHLSGAHGQRKNSENSVSSGLALRYEFQQLNSVLGQKSANLSEAELNIIKYWLKWQNREDLFDKIEVRRSQNFSLDDLSINLTNNFMAMDKIMSKHFAKSMQLSVSKMMLPDLQDADFDLIEAELEKNIPENPVGEPETNNLGSRGFDYGDADGRLVQDAGQAQPASLADDNEMQAAESKGKN
jgi:hypothetical protein